MSACFNCHGVRVTSNLNFNPGQVQAASYPKNLFSFLETFSGLQFDLLAVSLSPSLSSLIFTNVNINNKPTSSSPYCLRVWAAFSLHLKSRPVIRPEIQKERKNRNCTSTTQQRCDLRCCSVEASGPLVKVAPPLLRPVSSAF